METYAMYRHHINFDPTIFSNLLLKETFQIKIFKKKYLILEFNIQ